MALAQNKGTLPQCIDHVKPINISVGVEQNKREMLHYFLDIDGFINDKK